MSDPRYFADTFALLRSCQRLEADLLRRHGWHDGGLAVAVVLLTALAVLAVVA